MPAGLLSHLSAHGIEGCGRFSSHARGGRVRFIPYKLPSLAAESILSNLT